MRENTQDHLVRTPCSYLNNINTFSLPNSRVQHLIHHIEWICHIEDGLNPSSFIHLPSLPRFAKFSLNYLTPLIITPMGVDGKIKNHFEICDAFSWTLLSLYLTLILFTKDRKNREILNIDKNSTKRLSKGFLGWQILVFKWLLIGKKKRKKENIK